jgi:hypothetical protein
MMDINSDEECEWPSSLLEPLPVPEGTFPEGWKEVRERELDERDEPVLAQCAGSLTFPRMEKRPALRRIAQHESPEGACQGIERFNILG